MSSAAQTGHRAQIERDSENVFQQAMAALKSDRAVVVVRAPPGSGKTYLLSRIVSALREKKNRVVIAAQTNAQADDICRRLANAPWKLSSYRFVRLGGGMETPVESVTEVDHFDDLPHGPCTVVATSSKWGFVEIKAPFDVLLVDEAWQMQWSQFVPLGRVASRFVLIGDPGQIPPVVAVDASRWETTQIDIAWTDGIARDALLRGLQCCDLGQSDEAVLWHDISRLVWRSDEPVRRRDIDDAAPLVGKHGRQCEPRCVKGGRKIDGQDGIPLFRWKIL
jgi:hypothetical protein